MVSGFHGNVDPLMVLFLFWAAIALLLVAHAPLIVVAGSIFLLGDVLNEVAPS